MGGDLRRVPIGQRRVRVYYVEVKAILNFLSARIQLILVGLVGIVWRVRGLEMVPTSRL